MAQEGTPEQARGLLGPRGKLYQDLYESAPLAYLSVGLDGSIRTANRGVVELFGYSLDDLIGRPVLDLYADTPARRSKANEMFQRFRSGENIRDEELEIRRADGQHRWISLSVRPVTDEDGRVLASRSIAVDVTARKQAQEALEKANQTLETIIQASPLAIIVLDPQGHVEMWNTAAELLSADGHQVETAANGVIALNRIERRHYDLIVSDLKMPELDGLALYRELGCRHPDYTRRMIFLTGDVLDPEIHEFLERTGAPALMKPFALDEVRRVVQQVLRGRP